MKKIIFVAFLSIWFSRGYSQLSENFDFSFSLPEASGNWMLSSGNWLVTDNMGNTLPNWEFSPNIYPGNGGLPSKAGYIQRYNSGAGVVSEEWLITPQQALTPLKQLRFFTAQTVNGDLGTLYQVRVSTDADPSNLASYTVLTQYTETQLSTLTPSQLDYEEKIINLTQNGNYFVAFVRVFTQPTAATSGDRWLIDDIKIVDQCPDPTFLTATNVSVYNATLNWEGSAPSYTIEYGLQGFTPNTGAGTILNGFVGNTYEIPLETPTGPLSPNTNYEFYVTANCGAISSLVTGPFSFKTLNIGAVCETPIVIGSLPYFGADATSNYGNNIVIPFDDDTNCGTTNFFFGGDDVVYSYTAPATTSGVIDIIMNPLGNNHSAIFVYNSCAEIGTTCLASAGDWGGSVRTISGFNINPGQTIYIIISSNEFNSAVGYYLAIQEVTCTSPTLLSSLATSATGVALSWQQAGGLNSWEVFVQNSGEFLPTTAGVATSVNTAFPVTALTADATPLAFGNTYQYWVRASCGDGTFSSWVGPFPFTTAACSEICNYNFIISDVIGDGWAPNKFRVVQNGSTVAVVGNYFTDGAGPISVNVPLCNGPFEIYLIDYDLTFIDMRLTIVNPFNQIILSDYQIGNEFFDVNAPLVTLDVNCDEPLVSCLPPVGLIFSDITTEGATLSWVPQGPAPLSYDVFIVPAGSPVPTETSVPTFNTTNTSAIITTLDDDTSYVFYVRAVCSFAGVNPWSAVSGIFTTLQNCNKPINLTLSDATENSLVFDWASDGAETEWEYIVVIAGSPLPAANAPEWISTLSHPVTLTGLTIATPYDVYVRAVCNAQLTSNPAGPVTENTILCQPADQCLYTITMKDFNEYGWVFTGNTMQISQNGVVVATFGSTFTSGPSATIQVPLCNGVPFELYWSTGTSFFGIGISITDPNGNVVYDKPFNAGQPGDVLYYGTGACVAPTCISPSNILVTNVAAGAVTFSWVDNNTPAAVSWDVIVVPASDPAPLQSVGGWINVNATTYTYSGLNAATSYKVYVRSVCSPTDKSFWSTGAAFTTLICEAANVCDYTFVMGDSIGGGWSNNTIQIIQNGVVVYTLTGPPATFETNSQSVVVSLCNNIPYSLLWNNIGNLVNVMSLSVLSPSGTEVYGFGVDEGEFIFGTTIFTGFSSCTPLNCPKPTQLYTTNVTSTSATLAWTESGTATQYEVIVLPISAPDPLPTDIGIPATNPYVATLTAGIQYKFYVRAICSATESSSWSAPYFFSLLLPNDNCSGATVLPVNPSVTCAQITTATLIGATQSPQFTDCTGAADDDVWFQFTATAPTHAITLSNFTGSLDFYPLTAVVYNANNCTGLSSIVCADQIQLQFSSPEEEAIESIKNSIVLKELVPGNVYFIRIYTTNDTPDQLINFSICLTTLPTSIKVQPDAYTPEQLVSQVLTNSDCSSVSNVTFSTGTNFNSVSGISYFTQNNSAFPFADGIVLSTGDVLGAPGPNVYASGGSVVGIDQWPGDPELDELIAAQGVSGFTNNATVLEFDFVPLTNTISFDFIFASEEYGIYQCFFADVFAFYLTDLSTSITTNLAVVPNTNIPVSVQTIRDSQYNSSCPDANAQYFDTFYGLPAGSNPLSAPINYTGSTVPLTATSAVTPGQQYHIKLAIADYSDSVVNSTVFLEGGSFNLGNVNVGTDLLVASGNAICAGGNMVLNSQLTSEFYTFTWTRNGEILNGENASTLTVTQAGTYTVTATYVNSICSSTDTIEVQFYDAIIPGPAPDINICSGNTTAVFDLTQNQSSILAPLSPDFSVAYFTSQQDADNNENAITAPSSYTNISNPQVIYVRVFSTVNTCYVVVNFSLIIQNLGPIFTLPSTIQLCGGNSQTIAITPTNFTLSEATYSWTVGGNPLTDASSSILVSTAGIYEITVNRSGCTTSASVTVTVVNAIVPIFDPISSLCQDAIAPELPLISENGIIGVWAPATINTTTAGIFDYVFTSSEANCSVTYTTSVEIIQSPQFGIQGDCDGNNFVLRSVPINGFNADVATYQWTNEQNLPVLNGSNPTLIITSPGVYNLVISYGGCESTQPFTATATNCTIQKGISPKGTGSGDGKNDFFDLEGLNVRKLEIFNRYGTIVYTMNNYTNQWYGQSDKGDELPDGTYYYVIARDGLDAQTGWIYINREK